jgi:EAL domain-containing protein (putative c-di-GMP-specific phosphodiesterase class I)/GGDEF domain-containing protein
LTEIQTPTATTPIAPATAPILLLSFHNRDVVSRELAAAGWNAIAARRVEGIEQRFIASGAIIIIVDARGAVDHALAAVTALIDAAEVSGAALLGIVDQGDQDAIDRLISQGVTHILEAPFSLAELTTSLRLAEHFAKRVAGAWRARGTRSDDALQTERTRRADSDTRDSLTGLSDAISARAWITQRMMRQRRMYVLLVAVSRLDMINAALGLEAGDNLLRSLAHRIEPLVAELGHGNAHLARIAGAEFVIAVDDGTTAERIGLLAQGIVEATERPFATGSDIARLGCRVAVIRSTDEDRDVSNLLRRASEVLAEAKALDTGRILTKLGDTDRTATEAASLHADLRAALQRDEIEVLFQPQVSITSGHIVGVEALARWRHPRHGELGAVTLFSAAEQSDYLVELSTHVQQRASEMAAAWPVSLAALRLSINVTAADMARPGFVDGFLKMVDVAGFPRDRLTVELTENGLMEDLSLAAGILAGLRAAGCRVAIDDFGTGYSSLAYLKALPLDYLKIDKGLAGDIEGSSRDSVVVRGVIDMARSLGLSVIAEGVETEEQLALLAREGCNLYQGFLCAKAIDVDALVALVAKRSR